MCNGVLIFGVLLVAYPAYTVIQQGTTKQAGRLIPKASPFQI
jgi:hypothetical protein